MVSTHEGKRNTEPDGLYKLLSQTDTQTIEDDLFTKSITQKEKEMGMGTKEKRELPTNH